MASVNKVILVGNLGRDPETRYTTSGDAVTNIRLATTDTWKDKAGEKQERTEWHNIVFYGRQAEIAGEYLKKGRQIYVEGRLQTRKWQDKEGQDRYTTEIIADRMQMLGSREGGGAPVAAEAVGARIGRGSACRRQRQRSGGEEERGRSGRRHSVLGNSGRRPGERRRACLTRSGRKVRDVSHSSQDTGRCRRQRDTAAVRLHRSTPAMVRFAEQVPAAA